MSESPAHTRIARKICHVVALIRSGYHNLKKQCTNDTPSNLSTSGIINNNNDTFECKKNTNNISDFFNYQTVNVTDLRADTAHNVLKNNAKNQRSDSVKAIYWTLQLNNLSDIKIFLYILLVS